MAEYTPQIEAQIGRLLAQTRAASPDRLAGVSEAEAAVFLARYAIEHAAEGVRIVDGSLVLDAPAEPQAPPPEPFAPAPLPAEPARDPNRGWMWALTVLVAPIGGIAAWALTRERDPRAARTYLLATAALILLPACLGVGAAIVMPTGLRGGAGASATWPASATGRPAFYYFGTAT